MKNMVLKIYNTLTRKKEIFKPIKPGFVGMYTCGPTVYDFAHIGNLRAFVFQDFFKRYLKYKGYKVKHVMNITDVDDKTIKNSRREGISLEEYTKRYKKAFFEDLEKLNIQKADIYPEATKHIKEMVELVKVLIKKGYAYKGKDGSVYYDISEFKEYGKLSHLKLKKLKLGARVSHDEYEKEEMADFALWKAWSPEDGDVFWETEIGKGRPGWHIECSAMSMKYLGKTFDIHMGGIDLIFPHHENEIAQSEAATGQKFVNYWVHNEHLIVEGRKMSKSLGNFYTLRDLGDYDPMAIRYVLLSTHYRQQLDFSMNKIKEAENVLKKLRDFISNVATISSNTKDAKEDESVEKMVNNLLKNFEEAMDNDLNISLALKHVFDFVNEINSLISEGKLGSRQAREVENVILKIDSVLGLRLDEYKEVWYDMDDAEPEIRKLLLQREDFRKKKEWKKADEIRNKLKDIGIIVEDTEHGPRWKKIK
jgi:cysteinyl-tRNA synthetase